MKEIAGILSLTFWTVSNGMMAFGHRDLFFDLQSRETDVPSNRIPFFSAVGGASFGVGAITALSMVFSDDTCAAGILAGVCGAVSWASGIVSIITTRAYDRAVR